LSLFFSISFQNSFLPSIFYFRYFLLSVGIYYLIIKYKFFINFIFYSLVLTFTILLSDSLFQYFFGFNIFGYSPIYDPTPVLTSFFNDEKKLGSYIVRLLPFFLGIFYYLKKEKYMIYIFHFSGFIVFLSSERVALFLFFIIILFTVFITKKKTKIIFGLIFIFSILFLTEQARLSKYSIYTLQQMGVLDAKWNQSNGKIRYFSKEHENLSYTALVISKDKLLTGNGIKNFHLACNLMKTKKKENNINYSFFVNRDNELACSTHPHNTYLQILSEIGIFGFLMILGIFIKIFILNIKIIIKKKFDNIQIGYYFANIGIIVNLIPFIPSGSFFNNWMSLILFYPLGFWLYMNSTYINSTK
ncbi:O-antigen ligase family protein, partial [Candidatus Pelagibacter sp.]|nr:O-antigen ligase family protein [Candidatus Pelagibacter sp.]